MRSSKSLPTKLKKTQAVTKVLRLELDLEEDIECERLSESEKLEARSFVDNELLKLVPENYVISVLPTFFNYTDAERIRSVIVDQA